MRRNGFSAVAQNSRKYPEFSQRKCTWNAGIIAYISANCEVSWHKYHCGSSDWKSQCVEFMFFFFFSPPKPPGQAVRLQHVCLISQALNSTAPLSHWKNMSFSSTSCFVYCHYIKMENVFVEQDLLCSLCRSNGSSFHLDPARDHFSKTKLKKGSRLFGLRCRFHTGYN